MAENKHLKNNLFRVIFCAVLCLFFAFVFGAVFQQFFISNDDITLLSIMNGSYTGAPEAHLIYIMYPLGLLFKFLYTLAPKVHWYEGFTILIHILVVCFTALRFSQILFSKDSLLFKNHSDLKNDSLNSKNDSQDLKEDLNSSKIKKMILRVIAVFLFFLLIFGLDLKFYIENQYTVLSGLLSAGAVFQLSVLHLAKSKKEAVLSIVVSVFFFSVSLLLRKEACLMSLPLYLLAGIYSLFCELLRKKYVKSEEGIREREKVLKEGCASPEPDVTSETKNECANNINFILYLAGFFAMILIACLSLFSDRLAYNSDEWKAFRAYNEARTDVFDYNLLPEYVENQEFFNEMGIDEAGYTALKEYNLVLVNGLTTEKLNRIADRQREVLNDWSRFYSVPKKAAKDTLNALLENVNGFTGMLTLLIMLLAFLSVTVFFREREKGISAAAFILSVLYFVAFTGLFTYLGRLPDRVYYVLDIITVFFLLGIMVSAYCICPVSPGKKMMNYIFRYAFAILSVLIFLGAVANVNKNQEKYSENSQKLQQLASYVREHPENVYFVSSGVYASAVKSMGRDYFNEPVNLVKMVDWAYQSPLTEKKYGNLGITNRPDTLVKENVFFIVKEGMTDTDWIAKTVKDSGEESCQVQNVDVIPGGQILKVLDDTNIRK